jgi:hypothetical protein
LGKSFGFIAQEAVADMLANKNVYMLADVVSKTATC